MTKETEHPTALIIDDEPDILELLELTLQRMQIQTASASNIQEARRLLSRRSFDLCLTDMRLPDGNGIELVREVQASHPQMPVAVITAHGDMNTAIEALKAGAFDFVNKPVELQTLRELVGTALRLGAANGGSGSTTLNLIGHSKAIEQIRKTAAKLARSQAPVYISGESGTGKELVARLIHAQGPRAEQPFVPVNCGAIPQELMESEFFGHKRGSFTGAQADKDGLFQAAHGGTLFLDEVADLPLAMQVKLLRAIQEKAVRPVGAQQEQHVDVRILSATHKDLAQLVKEGQFREDLFYRINVIELHIPPLRERAEDIPELAQHILTRLAEGLGQPRPHLVAQALKRLQTHSFPGNIRELENILERALTLCEGDTIEEEDLQLAQAPQPATPSTVPTQDGQDLEAYLNEVERQAIVHALEQARYNKTQAAKLLGISFRALRYRLDKLGLD